MPGPDSLLTAPAVFVPWLLLELHSVLAYGPAPGMELIPYFLALVAWVGAAVVGVLLWPISGLLRRLRRGRGDSREVVKSEPKTASVPESPAEGNHDRG